MKNIKTGLRRLQQIVFVFVKPLITSSVCVVRCCMCFLIKCAFKAYNILQHHTISCNKYEAIATFNKLLC